MNIGASAPGGSCVEFDLAASELQLGSSDVVDVPGCTVVLDVDYHPGEVIVRGAAHVALMLQCARCLEPFESRAVYDFALVIKLLRKGELGGDMDGSSDDYFVMSDSTDEFDMTPIVRERILLSLPLKPLCDENCKGLCPMCGANRNVERCNCGHDRIDERWNGLLKLKQQYGGK